ncbi:GNAT family protein [Streptomyces sp. NPDC048659]|uniref:GNAT family N-acetyltransferase n=1 Tax=Streptomyces sp. NPDC048659 TaxID=3155489 RepID=UPI0034195C0C
MSVDMNEDANTALNETDGDGAAGEERVVVWRGAGVGFSALDVDDAELLASWRVDPVAAHHIGFWPRPLSALRERIEQHVEDNERDDFLVLRPDGTPVGHIALTDQSQVDGTAEVELLLAAPYRGRGYGPAALDALVDLAFGELPMHRLTASTHTDNAPALAVLAASGFTQEGVARSACLHRARRHDLAQYALLRPEWERLDRPHAWDA